MFFPVLQDCSTSESTVNIHVMQEFIEKWLNWIACKSFLLLINDFDGELCIHFEAALQTHQAIGVVAHVPERDEGQCDPTSICCRNLVLTGHHRGHCPPDIQVAKLHYRFKTGSIFVTDTKLVEISIVSAFDLLQLLNMLKGNIMENRISLALLKSFWV